MREELRQAVMDAVTAASEGGVSHGLIQSDVEGTLSILEDPGVYYRVYFTDSFDSSQADFFPGKYPTAKAAREAAEASWADAIDVAPKGNVGPLVWSGNGQRSEAMAIGHYRLDQHVTAFSTYTIHGPYDKE